MNPFSINFEEVPIIPKNDLENFYFLQRPFNGLGYIHFDKVAHFRGKGACEHGIFPYYITQFSI